MQPPPGPTRALPVPGGPGGGPGGPPPAALPSQGPPGRTVDALRTRLDELGIPGTAYRIGPPAGRAWTMDQTEDGWRVGWFDREFVAPAMFEDVADASAFLLGKLLLDADRWQSGAAPPPPPAMPAPVPPPAEDPGDFALSNGVAEGFMPPEPARRAPEPPRRPDSPRAEFDFDRPELGSDVAETQLSPPVDRPRPGGQEAGFEPPPRPERRDRPDSPFGSRADRRDQFEPAFDGGRGEPRFDARQEGGFDPARSDRPDAGFEPPRSDRRDPGFDRPDSPFDATRIERNPMHSDPTRDRDPLHSDPTRIERNPMHSDPTRADRDPMRSDPTRVDREPVRSDATRVDSPFVPPRAEPPFEQSFEPQFEPQSFEQSFEPPRAEPPRSDAFHTDSPPRGERLPEPPNHHEPATTIAPPAARPAPAPTGGSGAASANQEWPIGPLPGEPPLTLFRGKRLVELEPGMEFDRFGDDDGNLVYALGTPFAERSLVPEWIDRPYHAYRVRQPVQVLTGSAIPWFDQPGGGTAYLLPDAVGELLAGGQIVEVNGRERPA